MTAGDPRHRSIGARPLAALSPYVRGVYRRGPRRPWRDVEIVGRHPDGDWILREIGKLWPGVWLARGDQVRLQGVVFALGIEG